MINSIYQNGRPMESYVEEFLKYCHMSTWDDVRLMDWFWSGLDF